MPQLSSMGRPSAPRPDSASTGTYPYRVGNNGGGFFQTGRSRDAAQVDTLDRLYRKKKKPTTLREAGRMALPFVPKP